MIALCLALVAVGFGIALPACWGAMRLGRRIGAHDTEPLPGQVKPERRAIPNTGGIGIYLAIALPLLAGLGVPFLFDAGSLPAALEPLSRHMPGLRERAPMGLLLLGCITLLHVLGLIDDRRPMGPWLKLAVMAAPAVLMVMLTEDTRLLTLLDAYAGGPWLSITLTILWLVGVTNAMNFIDNMDGLCGSVSAIAGACFLAAALLSGQWFVAAVLALLVGACLGFLVWNVPPARLFMGDSGSLVLGFTLAFLTVRCTYIGTEGTSAAGAWYGVFMPVMVLAIPLYDFVTVTLVRLSQGKSPFVGDMQHLSHRLVKRGLSKRAAVGVIAGLTLVIGLGGVALGSLKPWQAALAVAQAGVLLGVVAMIEWRTSRGAGS